MVAWDVAEREEAQIAADLVSRACLRERIGKGRPSPLILHADKGNAMRAATLESRLEELGVLRCFFRPRVRNDNSNRNRCSTPCRRSPAERLIPAGLPQRPFQSVELACAWVAAFVDWYNHQHRHSGIPAAGAAALAAGVSRRLSGSILRHRTTAALRLSWQWPPDRRQGRHLSWQSPQRPGDIASVAELVIRCLEKDLALSQELVADLAVECLLVRFHRQQEVGQLFLELPKNRFLLWSAAPSEKDALTAWISTPSRPSSPRSFLSTARSWFSPKAWQAWL